MELAWKLLYIIVKCSLTINQNSIKMGVAFLLRDGARAPKYSRIVS
jgi:hypothetical protein